MVLVLKACGLCRAGPTQKPQINAVSNPGKFFGATEFGFSKKNEVRCVTASTQHLHQLWTCCIMPPACHGATSIALQTQKLCMRQVLVGRTAQLGFLAAVIGEKITGRGILRQIGLETGVGRGMYSWLQWLRQPHCQHVCYACSCTVKCLTCL